MEITNNITENSENIKQYIKNNRMKNYDEVNKIRLEELLTSEKYEEDNDDKRVFKLKLYTNDNDYNYIIPLNSLQLLKKKISSTLNAKKNLKYINKFISEKYILDNDYLTYYNCYDYGNKHIKNIKRTCYIDNINNCLMEKLPKNILIAIRDYYNYIYNKNKNFAISRIKKLNKFINDNDYVIKIDDDYNTVSNSEESDINEDIKTIKLNNIVNNNNNNETDNSEYETANETAYDNDYNSISITDSSISTFTANETTANETTANETTANETTANESSYSYYDYSDNYYTLSW